MECLETAVLDGGRHEGSCPGWMERVTLRQRCGHGHREGNDMHMGTAHGNEGL